ncbi:MULTISPECIES: hypothetical protein [unclassified Salinibacterium]|uniref:membrane protein YczE n=1 Tax=unclassified Salinibacterium TaxID=2632331 RepID=UPI001CD609E9|nr:MULTISPECIES: hypothetical protein [unclassified Salinibacterium]
MSPATTMVRRILQLAIGLFLYGIGIALMVRAAIGVAPWDVLTQGIARQTGWSFGLITVLTSFVVLLIWIPIREKPGIGTVANAILVGPAAEVGLLLVPVQTHPVLQVLAFAGGLALVAIATGLYIGARFGPGPRDGLMTGLHRVTGWPIWVVRTGIEVTVLAIGWLLGGNVGLGTVAFALLIGPMAQPLLRLLLVPEPVRKREVPEPAPANALP